MGDRPSLYLASRSPRRRELLQQIGVRFELLDIEVDEGQLPEEQPANYVRRVAEDKAVAGFRQLSDAAQLPVLAADTSVVVNGHILGKPEDRDHALWMLGQLSDTTHEVFSAVTLCRSAPQTRVSVSRVTFRRLSETEMLDYWHTGEPLDKAGSYAIQGLGAQFIARLEGSYSGVMGLPLFETAQLLQLGGIDFGAGKTNLIGPGSI
ncbi:septum formation protein Maf [Candidatus Thiodiazotropha endoloripes]|uniref:Maf family protein n=1 Tax=Candidatus Thiodiazotropha endoloripes TaxID=1818881 RepID=UPI00083CBC4A|nr:Maf family protein [Candidatus Thiodiazotropha endoloripes]MCG7901896.1 Maf-like protein [Candidatus Thiodiazotropha weberae]MCG7913011.1 Maf-like protein [Candidatus Thiodiazotropha weberae]ODB93811.1 septum formation protein Maf [Candidatus Thiodiazotropha endoloripes]